MDPEELDYQGLDALSHRTLRKEGEGNVPRGGAAGLLPQQAAEEDFIVALLRWVWGVARCRCSGGSGEPRRGVAAPVEQGRRCLSERPERGGRETRECPAAAAAAGAARAPRSVVMTARLPVWDFPRPVFHSSAFFPFRGPWS